MQAWDQVKVTKAGDPFEGQAGLVVKVAGDAVFVKLDLDSLEHEFVTADLQLLGR